MPETGEQKRQRVARNLARLKAAQRPQDEIDEYIASERETVKPEYGTLDKIGTTAQTFSDASTFGMSGLADDAISAALGPSTFAGNRDARKESKEQLNPYVRTVAEVTGALVNPANKILPFGAGGGFLKTVGKLGAEGAAQAGLQAVGENVGTSRDPTGLGHARSAAGAGALGGAALGAASRAFPIAQTGIRAFRGNNLGETSKALKDTRHLLDRAQYDIADAEAAAAGGTSQTLADHLANTPELEKIVAQIRKSKSFKNASDYEVAQEAFRQLSTREGELMKRAQSAAVSKTGAKTIAKVETAKRDIPLVKNELVPAIETVAPSFDWANAGHASRMGQRKAFERAADKANMVMLGQDVAGSAMEKESALAWLDEIDRMTPEEAKAALKGVMGRIKEIPEFTSNPVGQFGLKSSLAKVFLGPSRIQPYIAALEKKAGMLPRSRAIRDLAAPALGRVVGTRIGHEE